MSVRTRPVRQGEASSAAGGSGYQIKTRGMNESLQYKYCKYSVLYLTRVFHFKKTSSYTPKYGSTLASRYRSMHSFKVTALLPHFIYSGFIRCKLLVKVKVLTLSVWSNLYQQFKKGNSISRLINILIAGILQKEI